MVLAGPATDWSRAIHGPGIRGEHSAGRDFVTANGRSSFWLFTVARWACIPFSLLGGVSCYRWATDLYGQAAGTSALTLWCFSPNVLAHAQLLTPDITVTAISVTACHSLWRWSYNGSWRQAVTTGIVLGMAVLAKTNALALILTVPVACYHLLLRNHRRNESAGKAGVQAFVIALLVIYTINAGYAFQSSLNPLGGYRFVSHTFTGHDGDNWRIGNRFEGTFLEKLPVPFPAAFIEGIDLQRHDFENLDGTRFRTYYRGQWYARGWWWYYFPVMGLKTPLGTWLLLVLAVISRRMRRKCTHVASGETIAAIAAILLFALPSSQTGFGGSLRYILPVFPFLFVLASAAFSSSNCSRGYKSIRIAAMVWILSGSLNIYPHSLAYFNELAGGPLNGHSYLLDGNIDWGEDLIFLEEWRTRNEQAIPLRIAFWGFLPLKDLEVQIDSPMSAVRSKQADSSGSNSGPLPGWYAVSVSYLRRDYRNGHLDYSHFMELEPIETVGYTVYIFHITDAHSSE